MCRTSKNFFGGVLPPAPPPPPGKWFVYLTSTDTNPAVHSYIPYVSFLLLPPPLFPTHLPSFPLLTLFTAAAQLILEMAIVFWTWKRLSFRRKTNDRRIKWIVSRKEEISFFRNERKRVNCKILVDFYVRHG